MDFKKIMKLNSPPSIKDIEYTQSALFVSGVRGCLMPTGIFTFLLQVLAKDSKSAEVFQEVGKHQAERILRQLIGEERFPITMKNVQLILRPIPMSGLGQPVILRFSPSTFKGIIKIEHSAIGEKMHSQFPDIKKPVDYFLAGVIQGCLERICQKKMVVQETQCVTQGKPYCTFSFSPA